MAEETRPLVWTDELVARFWAYQSRFPENYFSYKSGAAVAGYLRRLVSGPADVLDYGCGPGLFVPHLLAAGFRVTGADVDESATGAVSHTIRDKAFGGFESIDKLLCDGRRFDVVVLLEVIEHLDNHWLEVTLQNAMVLLRPGGLLFVTTPNEERLEDNFVYCPASDRVFHRWQHVRSWSASTLTEVLSEQGFVGVGSATATFPETRSANVSYLRWRLSSFASYFRKPKSLVGIGRAPTSRD